MLKTEREIIKESDLNIPKAIDSACIQLIKYLNENGWKPSHKLWENGTQKTSEELYQVYKNHSNKIDY